MVRFASHTKPAAAAIMPLMRASTQPKSAPYVALASASRAAAALAGGCGTWTAG